jgi:GTP cyclohydrolase FolE2
VQQERLTGGADLQASEPEVRIGLSRAGVTGVQKAVRLQHGGRDALVSAEIDCFVDLDPAQKGVHMSRFPEVFSSSRTSPSTSRATSSSASRPFAPR